MEMEDSDLEKKGGGGGVTFYCKALIKGCFICSNVSTMDWIIFFYCNIIIKSILQTCQHTELLGSERLYYPQLWRSPLGQAGGGGGGKIGTFMYETIKKKPKINSIGLQHTQTKPNWTKEISRAVFL